MFGADLREGVAGDGDVFFGFEAQRAAVGMPALQNKFPGARGKEQRTFLLDHGDALARGCAAVSECVTKPLSRTRPESGCKGAGDEFQQSGFAAGVWAEDGDDFAGARLKTGGFEREERRLRRIRRSRRS